MSEPFFSYIKDNRNTVSNRLYGTEDVEKRYGRLPYQALPQSDPFESRFTDLLATRKSTRAFSDKKLPLTTLARTLQYSLARDEQYEGLKKYPFPSGGGFYPIETYLLIHNVEDLEDGIYHYATTDHSIAFLSPTRYTLDRLNIDFMMAFESMPHVLVLMTLVKGRCIHKYGSLIYSVYPIEAGHRGQNICLSALANGLGSCPMGGGRYDNIHSLLNVDGVGEHYVYGVSMGIPRDDVV